MLQASSCASIDAWLFLMPAYEVKLYDASSAPPAPWHCPPSAQRRSMMGCTSVAKLGTTAGQVIGASVGQVEYPSPFDAPDPDEHAATHAAASSGAHEATERRRSR